MNLQDQISQAKSSGYSDDEITSFLSDHPDVGSKVKIAKDAGYNPSEIVSFLSSGKPVQEPSLLDKSVNAFNTIKQNAQGLNPWDAINPIAAVAKLAGANPNSVDETGMNVLRGVGKQMMDWNLAAQQHQAVPDVTGLSDKIMGRTNAIDDAFRKAADEKKRIDAPLMNTGGGQLGAIAAQTVPLMLTGGSGTVPQALLQGSLLGGMEPTGSGENTLWNAAKTGLGTAAGQGAFNTLGYFLRGAPDWLAGKMSPAIKDALEFYKAKGGTEPLTMGQLGVNIPGVNNSYFKKLDNLAANVPFVGGEMTKNANSIENVVNNTVNPLRMAAPEGGSIAGPTIGEFSLGKSGALDQKLMSDIQSIHDVFAPGTNAGANAPTGALKEISNIFGNTNPQSQMVTWHGQQVPLVNFSPSAQVAIKNQGLAPSTNSLGLGSVIEGNSGDPLAKAGTYQGIRETLNNLRQDAKPGTPDAAVYTKSINALDDWWQRTLGQQGISTQPLTEARKAYTIDRLLNNAVIPHADNPDTYSRMALARLIDKASKNGRLLENMGPQGDELGQLSNFVKTIQPAASSGTGETNAVSALLGALANSVRGDKGAMMNLGKTALGLTLGPKLFYDAVQSPVRGVLPQIPFGGQGLANLLGKAGESAPIVPESVAALLRSLGAQTAQ